MLESLSIHNLALIEDLQIEFSEGFNVLSGETGAGKSIILGALGLLLGERVDSSVVRSGCDEASVSALFLIPKESEIHPWLGELQIELEDERLLLRRVVKMGGRSFVYIQSQLMRKADLNRIATALFDIHGQHQHQSLLYNESQRRVLDNYGGLNAQREALSRHFRQVEELKKERQELEQSLAQIQREADYLQFVADELVNSDLKEGEDDLLGDEIKLLSEFETISENLELAYTTLKGEGGLSSLAIAMQAIEKAARGDTSLLESYERLDSIYVETQDLVATFRDRLSSITFSQERLDELQGRQAQLQRLKKKYGPTLSMVIAYRDEVVGKLSQSEGDDEALQKLTQKIATLEEELQGLGRKLSRRRKEVALELQKVVTERLVHLGMPHVNFTIACEAKELSGNGADHIEFLFSANLGEPLRKLKDIISGGELSRVMLAIKSALAENDAIETLIFDEVDAGIGGAVAIAVGEQMGELAQSRQIIVITHIASIASQATQHFVVEKVISEGRTYTQITPIEGGERVREIARMLSGDGSEASALRHAEALLGGGEV